MRWRAIVVVVAAIGCLLLATGWGVAADRAKADAAAVDAAIADLKREYLAHLKDPDAAPLRPQCTYFVEHPAPVTLSPDTVLTALEKPVGNDPRLTAYVRWQLLSAAPKKFEADAKRLPRVLEAYQRAPAPPERFGLSSDTQAKLDGELKNARKEDDATLSAKLEELVAKEAEANQPILAYRDELYARLPGGFDSLLAGFQDAHERTVAAAGGGVKDEHAAKVVADAQAWAQSGQADPRQCGQLAELVAKLRHVRSPPYYARATLRRGDVRLSWATRTDAVYSPTKLSNLEKVLRDVQKAGQAQKAAQSQKPVKR